MTCVGTNLFALAQRIFAAQSLGLSLRNLRSRTECSTQTATDWR